MYKKLLIGLSFNTVGAAIIVFGTLLTPRLAAIAISSLGAGVSAGGMGLVLLLDRKELEESRRETREWAEHTQQCLVVMQKLNQEKEELMSQLNDIQWMTKDAKEQCAIAIALIDQEIEAHQVATEKVEEAERN